MKAGAMSDHGIEVGSEAQELARRLKAVAGRRFAALGVQGTWAIATEEGPLGWSAHLFYWNEDTKGGTKVVADADTPIEALIGVISQTPWKDELL